MKIIELISDISELEDRFTGYDLVVGKCSIANYGYAFITECNDVLDWKLSFDDVKQILETNCI